MRKAVKKLLSRVIKPKRSPWPRPKDSIGRRIHSMKGRTCWVATGPAREAFDTLADDIKACLEDCAEPVPHSDFITWSIYMFGRSPEKAYPVILFVCEDLQTREKAQQTIKNSGILERYPGLQTGHAPSAPESSSPKMYAAEFIENQEVSDEVISPPMNLIKISGNHLMVTTHLGNDSLTRLATIGGVIRHQNDVYIFSASHPLDIAAPQDTKGSEEMPSWRWITEDDNNSEASDDCDETIVDEKQAREMSPDDLPKACSHSEVQSYAHLVTRKAVENGSTAGLKHFHEAAKPNTRFGALQTPPWTKESSVVRSTELDYAVFKIAGFDPFTVNADTNRTPSVSRHTSVISTGPKDTKVVACTRSRGLVTGRLDETPSYARLPNCKTYQEVYTARFEEPLSKGDCGAWVLDIKTGGLYGHIVAGSGPRGVAYIMSAHNVFADVKERVGESSNADLTLEAFWPYDACHSKAKPTRSNVPPTTELPAYVDAEPQLFGAMGHFGLDKAQVFEKSSHVPSSRVQERAKTTIVEENKVQKEDDSENQWKSISSTNCALADRFEDTGYVDSLMTLNAEGDVLRVFMCGHDDRYSNMEYSPARKVLDYCYGVSDRSIREHSAEMKSRDQFVALLDDRVFVEGIGQTTGPGCPLTAYDLFRELSKPRWQNTNHYQAAMSSTERRLIFITNVDRWTVHALARTASCLQASALRDALCKHLGFETFLGTSSLQAKSSHIQLSFHLPYYAWRRGPEPKQDHRKNTDGVSLRHHQDVSFLDWSTHEARGFLYEAQVSCVVTGLDDSWWVGYCFVDTYFDAGGEGDDNIGDYHEMLEDDYEADPSTLGWGDTSRLHDPRHYFLLVVSTRLERVKLEWEQVVYKLKESARHFDTNGRHALFLSTSQISRDPKQHRKLKDSIDWTVQITTLSKKLLSALTRTIGTCKMFRDGNPPFFKDLAANGEQSLQAIRKTLLELDSLKESLQDQVLYGEDHRRTIELYLLLTQREEVAGGERAVSTLTSSMMLYISPIALTAGLFSMDPPVLPFHKNIAAFVGMLMLFMGLGSIIQSASSGQLSRVWRVAAPPWNFKCETLKLKRGELFGRRTRAARKYWEGWPV
ncbi:hypothetical protein H2200_006265 [Cladophialophora chaetospira]|uniref:Uncharacterized protein n=1 Tax=Cladophialophora chaetospira TaxID=386627 RepID=A0AA38XAU8_9EURO|nr:hypothetical protein H2200_006265 [Cladophialophora chaetospira]